MAGQCIIARDQNGEIQEVLAPNGRSSNLFKDILESLGVSFNIRTTASNSVLEVYKSNPELSKIGSASEYQEYINTIFPDSQVKDIVYHGTDGVFDKFDKSFTGKNTGKIDEGFVFSKIINYSKTYGKNIIAAILNIKNPYIGLFDRKKEFDDVDGYITPFKSTIIGRELTTSHSVTNFIVKDYDSVDKIITIKGKKNNKLYKVKGDNVFNLKNITGNSVDYLVNPDKTKVTSLKPSDINQVNGEYVVFEPEQIHILGSKQDIEGFKTFKAKNKTFNIKEKALKIWARAYTPTFKDKFGDWELISQAKGVADNIKGVYKDIFDNDPQRIMFEASIQSHSSKVEHENAVKTFGKEIVDLSRKLFPNAKVGQTYKPIVSRPLDVNGEPLITSVLNSTEKEQQTRLEVAPDIKGMSPIALAERLAKKLGIPYELDVNLNKMGKIENGRVIMNPATFTLETVFHEYSHPFVAAIQKANPALYKNLVSRAKAFTYNGMLLSEFVQETNPDLEVGSDAFNNEVITTAIGLAASGATVEDKVKFTQWLKTVFQKIADYINSLIEDPSQKIKPEDLDANMKITDLADLMKLENEISLDSIEIQSVKGNQTTTATTWGSRKTIDFFEQQAQAIKLVENGDESYYTDGSIDPVTSTLRKYSRLTSYTHDNFAVTKYGDEYSSEKSIEDTAIQAFKDANASLTEKIPFRGSADPLSFEEIKTKIQKDSEKARMKGKVMHKMIEGYLKHTDMDHYADDIEGFMNKADLSAREFFWFDTNRVKGLLGQLGINTEEFGITDIAYRDNIASELTMTNPDLGIGTANDFFVEHSDGSVSFIDFKTGTRFLDNEDTVTRLMQYSESLSSPIYDSTLNRAKVELVMRMIMAKMNKPDLQVRDLKIAHISKFHGNQVRHVDVQQYLDYINNNMRVSINQLTKDVKKKPELKEELEMKKKQYAAMKAAKVFDFQNYVTPANLFGIDETLDTITDPAKRLEHMKKKLSQKAAESLIHNKDIRVDTLDATKKFLYGVLNEFRASNEGKLESAERKDIGVLVMAATGLRDQNNAFLKTFSRFFENAQTKVTQRVNEIVGEQSEFRKADRALHKEYFERTGRSQSTGVKLYSYPESNAEVPLSEQGIFDFMYTIKDVGGKPTRVGAVYTEQGKLTDAQWNYYKVTKKVLKEQYEAIRTKVAYIDKNNKPVTYAEEFARNNVTYDRWSDSFLPTIPYQSKEEILAKNYNTGKITSAEGLKGLAKDYWENYQDRYNLAIQNELRFNIGLPLKYMHSGEFVGDDHSFDVSTAVDMFTRNMVTKYEMDDVYNIGKLTKALMTDTRDSENVDKIGRLKQTNAITSLNEFLEQHLLGRRRVTTKWGLSEKGNIGVDRAFDHIGAFMSKNAFWFAPVTSLANGLYGVFTDLKEGIVGSLSKRLFGDENAVTLSHVLAGMKESAVHQGVNLTKNSKIKRQLNEDWEGSYYKDKVNFMSKMFRLNNKSYAFRDDSLMLNVHNRVFTGDSAYFMQGLGEDFSNETLVIAALKARKVEVKSVENGEEVTKYLKKDGTYTTNPRESGLENMWDIYKLNEKTGEYEYTGPVRFRDKDGNEVKGLTDLEQLRVKQYLEKIYGSYSPEQRTVLERYSWGRALMKFRKFQVLNIRENFTIDSYQQYLGEYKMLINPDGSPKLKDGQPLYDWQSERTKARLKIIAAMVGGWFNDGQRLKWKDMSNEEKRQFLRLAHQLIFFGFILVGGMGAFVPPEDKDKLYVKRITRLAQDLAQIDPADMLRGVTTIDSYPEMVYKAGNAVVTTIRSLITDDIVESGPYKGDYKGWNTLEDFIPIYHSTNQAVKLVTGE